MSNHGNYIVSLSNLCRWLGSQAEALGVEIYPGFPAHDLIIEDDIVKGVITGDLGVAKDGHHKPDYQPGMELRGKYTLFAEGARGSLSKILGQRFGLQDGPRAAEIRHRPERTLGTAAGQASQGAGGAWLRLAARERHRRRPLHVSLGRELLLHRICGASQLQQSLSGALFSEFQRAKTHPAIRKFLEGGKRVGYGARAITEGGFQSVPKLAFPGGALIGCAAGFVNVPRIKGSHNAIRTGMMAAEAAFAAIGQGRANDTLEAYESAYAASAVARDLKRVRNAKPLWSKLGTLLALPFIGLDLWTNQLLGFSFFGTLGHGKPDFATLKKAKDSKPIAYPKPDGKLTFDRLSSVFVSNTNHEEDQPVHLVLRDPSIPIRVNLPEYAEPAQRYCPAGVYEVVEEAGVAAVPDQRAELRSLQNLRHQGSGAEYHLGHARRRRRPQLFEYVRRTLEDPSVPHRHGPAAGGLRQHAGAQTSRAHGVRSAGECLLDLSFGALCRRRA